VFLPTKQVSAFVKLFKKANGKRRAKIRDLWTNLVPTALEASNRWAKVSGPIHATVATLCDLGWDVSNFREWLSPDGKPFSVLAATKNEGPLLEEVRAGASLRAWSMASHHCLGQGLEKGEPGLDIARSAKAKFIKEGNYDEAKAVDLLVCGACFASKTQGTCPCGAPDGPQHRYWDCSRLQELDNAEFKKGKWLKTVIFKPNSHLEVECLWGRGLLPANWRPEREEGRMPPIETLTAKENFALAKDTFLDGSGGTRSVMKCCGSAAVALRTSNDDEADDEFRIQSVDIIISEVPGRQTVPRSELQAARLGLKYQANKKVLFRPDATYTHNNFKDYPSKRDKLARGTNGDLWEKFGHEVEEAKVDTDSSRIPSHTKIKALITAPTIPLRAFLGNHLVDVAADVAASKAYDAQHVCTPQIEKAEAVAYNTIRRLAIIEAERWRSGISLVPEPTLEPGPVLYPIDMANDTEQRLHQAGHDLVRSQNRVFCTKCRRTSSKGVKAWFKQCTAQCGEPTLKRKEQPQGEDTAKPKQTATAVETARRMNLVDTDKLVSVAKRRKVVAELRQQVKERGNKVAAIQDRIDAKIVLDLKSGVFDEAPLSPVPPPFVIHPSHACLLVGGYAGCVSCGAVTGWHNSPKFNYECRHTNDKAMLHPVKRLASGRPPVKRQCWPSGEPLDTTPTVFRWLPPRQTTQQAAAPSAEAPSHPPEPPAVAWAPCSDAAPNGASRRRSTLRFN